MERGIRHREIGTGSRGEIGRQGRGKGNAGRGERGYDDGDDDDDGGLRSGERCCRYDDAFIAVKTFQLQNPRFSFFLFLHAPRTSAVPRDVICVGIVLVLQYFAWNICLSYVDVLGCSSSFVTFQFLLK